MMKLKSRGTSVVTAQDAGSTRNLNEHGFRGPLRSSVCFVRALLTTPVDYIATAVLRPALLPVAEFSQPVMFAFTYHIPYRARKLITYIAAVVIALSFTTATSAGTNAHKMTLRQLEAAQVQIIKHDLHTIHWWNTHRSMWRHGRVLLGVRMHHSEPYDLWWHRQQLRWTKRELAETRAKIRAQTSIYPPHHKLWLCISRYEGSPTSVNPNGHYGMLQMHADWGYGTSHHASDDPQSVQEWAAEKAWAASNYSYSFLYGQWYEWDAADDCGTTG